MEPHPVENPIFTREASKPSIYRNYLKRIFDITLALIGLLLVGPIILLLACWVKLDSKGPVFYRGIRTGLNGKRFKIFKFRTMVPNAEKVGGGTTADHDPRITRIGGFLRRFKLDELPQLLNVLRGDMSFVGPRPELTEYTDQYNSNEKVILSVRPGITDYASLEFIQLGKICGNEDADRVYETQVLPKKNQLRIQYTQKLSFTEDVKIITRTVFNVFKQ